MVAVVVAVKEEDGILIILKITDIPGHLLDNYDQVYGIVESRSHLFQGTLYNLVKFSCSYMMLLKNKTKTKNQQEWLDTAVVDW